MYPPIEPYKTGRLQVSDLHNIYYEQVGNPKGSPVVFFHGGPGGGLEPKYRQFFDPKHYNIILMDQRGCGQSTPHAELQDNTTWTLIEDTEKIREELGIDKWIVFGGSWGSTLSLMYAITHPDRVKGLLLRGIFMCRPEEIRWFYQEGCSFLFPDAWEKYIEPIPAAERRDFVTAYYKRLTSPDKKVQIEAARAWSMWEASTSKLVPDKTMIEDFGDPEFAVAFARIECHYFINNIFVQSHNYILENTSKIAHIPTEIVHGRYDVVCPFKNAWDLHKALPKSKLHVIDTAGHSAHEPGIAAKLIEMTNRFRSL